MTESSSSGHSRSAKRVVVKYRGHVQGVGFRVTCVQQAAGLPVSGFVRNEPDGSVLLDAQGPQRGVDEFLRRIQRQMGHNLSETLIDDRDPIDGRRGFVISD